ncbi:MAG: META domain-containing protein [Dehalococcoidia bacterium]
MRGAWVVLALAGLAFGLVGCEGDDGDAVSLDGTSWVLESMDGEPVLDGSEITVSFTASEVSGSGGCNLYGGMYELDGDEITIGDELTATLRACVEEERMTQESAYLRALASAQGVRLEGDVLEIETEDGVLRYRRAS